MRELAVARVILWIMVGSYLLSAALLSWARVAGQIVPVWKIIAWAVTSIVAAALLPFLTANRPLIAVAILIALAPWMAFATYEDTRSRHFVIAVVDLAGLLAIFYAVWLVQKAGAVVA